PADDVEQGRLAAAARPDQAKELAARDVERGVAQRTYVSGVALLAELMRDAPDPDRDFIGAHDYGPGSQSRRLAIASLILSPLPARFLGRIVSHSSRVRLRHGRPSDHPAARPRSARGPSVRR